MGRTALLALDRVTDVMALTSLVVMVLIISWQVFGRYVLNSSPRWAPELSLVLLGWVTFLGIAIGIRERSHIAVTYFADKLPTRPLWLVERFGSVLMLAFGGYLILQGWKFTQLMSQNTMPATGLPRSWQYAAMPVSGVLISLYALLQVLGTRTETEIAGAQDHRDAPDPATGS